MSRTPSCSGTTKFIIPITNGIAMKKIMIVPCAAKIWSSARAASIPARRLLRPLLARIMMASEKPRKQHDQCQYDVHDTDALVVDRGEPLSPR